MTNTSHASPMRFGLWALAVASLMPEGGRRASRAHRFRRLSIVRPLRSDRDRRSDPFATPPAPSGGLPISDRLRVRLPLSCLDQDHAPEDQCEREKFQQGDPPDVPGDRCRGRRARRGRGQSLPRRKRPYGRASREGVPRHDERRPERLCRRSQKTAPPATNGDRERLASRLPRNEPRLGTLNTVPLIGADAPASAGHRSTLCRAMPNDGAMSIQREPADEPRRARAPAARLQRHARRACHGDGSPSLRAGRSTSMVARLPASGNAAVLQRRGDLYR